MMKMPLVPNHTSPSSAGLPVAQACLSFPSVPILRPAYRQISGCPLSWSGSSVIGWRWASVSVIVLLRSGAGGLVLEYGAAVLAQADGGPGDGAGPVSQSGAGDVGGHGAGEGVVGDGAEGIESGGAVDANEYGAGDGFDVLAESPDAVGFAGLDQGDGGQVRTGFGGEK